jgi:N-acetyl-gamma-glutamyl-phosphate reductase
MLKAAVLGASGYTGVELLRILSGHSDVEVAGVTSRQYAGASVEDAFPALRGFYNGLGFSAPDGFKTKGHDVVFSALPHGASQDAVADALASGCRVIDLSADFRLRDPSVYRAWYGEHRREGLLGEARYGLPELYRERIKGARLVANPGCYPTGASLALAPLVSEGVSDAGSIIIDSKSGASGAGRAATLDTSFVEVYGSFRAYKVGSHRHTPEIEQTLGDLAGARVSVCFTAHLLPVSRGILTTAYSALRKAMTTEELRALYAGYYAGEPFIRVLPPGKFPDIAHVRASNYCDIGVYADGARRRAIVVSAIDNLVKGASGQAVQNMNIVFGIKEDTGLRTPPAPF